MLQAESVRAAVLWGPCTLMDFTLRYEGPLPASGNKGRIRDGRLEKLWQMRRSFESQMAKLYERQQILTGDGGPEFRAAANAARQPIKAMGFEFVALVRPSMKLSCTLDIRLSVNHDVPSVLETNGDLDNRVKSIIDTLTVPRNAEEIRAFGPAPEEQPFACLMENDALVTAFSVECGRYLGDTPDPQHAAMEIDVTVTAYAPDFLNEAFR